MSGFQPAILGSSPRVRSRPTQTGMNTGSSRIISACAEQTFARPDELVLFWDHLRVCGADFNELAAMAFNAGSSPRVRSRRAAFGGRVYAKGIISACAEQTRRSPSGRTHAPDHLRVCGADRLKAITGTMILGSSPRVRSRPAEGFRARQHGGIISACAEQT